MNWRLILTFLISLALVAIGVLGRFSNYRSQAPQSIILPTPQSASIPSPTPDPAREQYYRAIYDVCFYYGVREHPGKKVKIKLACEDLIKRAMDKNWYEEKTPGWKWPIPLSSQEGYS